jgi:hypothetical protein
MLEDIVVLERSIGKDRGTCTLCGYPYPTRALLLREGEPEHGVRSAHAQVCPVCERLLRRGDEPAFPFEEAVHRERGTAPRHAVGVDAADDWWGHLYGPGWDGELTMVPGYAEEHQPCR